MIKGAANIVADLVRDGWVLGCGCLYLFVRGAESTVVVPTPRSNVKGNCAEYHRERSSV